MTTSIAEKAAGQDQATRTVRIDADSHNLISVADLLPYLPQRWRRYVETIGLRGQQATSLTASASPLASRADAWGPNGEPPGSDPALFVHNLLDRFDLDVAILNSTLMQTQQFMGPGSPRDLISALQRAGNDYEQEHWLEHDPRFRGAICVPFEDIDAAVAEVERCAADPRFVQILLPFRTFDPLGNPKYWPLLEIAQEHKLPIALHPAAQHVTTGAGWQSFYYEHHTALPAALYAQMASLIFEGALDRFPDVQILFTEGGWSWVAPYAWRLDSVWSMLRDEVPDLQRAPSEYVGQNFWFTTQPIEEPEHPRQLLEMFGQLEQVGLGEKLMFSSDYPHWDFDSPDRAIPRHLPEDVRTRIIGGNALKCYSRLGEV
ncbi:MAG: amidohydrolase [Hyphomicrobiales bacterium]|nr:MAG: amidohydrolase [Hyphomicrobiales bacterium]